jgi:hypothetical protein
MLDKKGRVKIADFGLAKILGREPETLRLTGAKDVMGTPHYMAPEQIEHPQEVDHRADIYSLGVVFYEMLTGELPLGKFQAPSKKVQVDVRLDEVVLHALEKEPERRYQQASQVKTDVETIAAAAPKLSMPVKDAPQPAHPPVLGATQHQEPRFTADSVQQQFIILAVSWWIGYPVSIVSEFVPWLSVICLPALIVMTVFWCILLYRHWSLLQGHGARTTPGKAVGYGFIPFFCFYWWFVAYAGLATDNNRYLGQTGVTSRRMSFRLAVTNCILGILGCAVGWFPVVGAVLAVPCMIIGFILVLQQRDCVLAILQQRAKGREAAAPASEQEPLVSAANRASGPEIGTRYAAVQATPSRPASSGGARFFVGRAWYVGILVGLALVAGLIAWGMWERRSTVSAETVVRVEGKLRQEIVQRLDEAGWRVDGVSVSVSPDLKRAECRFGTAWKNNNTSIPFNAAIHLAPQGRNLWLVTGDGEFQFLRFSVDASAQMSALPPVFQYAEPEKPARAAILQTSPPLAVVQASPLPFAQAKPGEFKVAVTNGVEFEVLAVASSPRSSTVWWQPDGKLLAAPPGDEVRYFPSLCLSGTSKAEFAVLVKGAETLRAEGNAVLAFDPLPQYVASAILYTANRLRQKPVIVAGYGAAPERLTCKVGLADGPWERVATWDQAGTLLDNESGGPLDLVRSGTNDQTCLKLSHRIDANRYALRLTARLKDGAYKTAWICRVQYASEQRARTCALIQGLQDAGVVAYELYRVPLRWAHIPGVATRPNVSPIQGNPTASGASGRTSQLDSLSVADRARAVALFNDIEDFGHEFEAAFATKSLSAAETGTRRLLNLLSNFNAVVKGTGYEFPAGIFEDIGKVQEALREGDWDKVQKAARHNDAYGREFKRIGARMVELARQ